MSVYVDDPDFTLYHGDSAEVLAQLEPDTIDCALTSPPFYGLRDYGVDGQIGLEASPDEWVGRLVEVFRGVRRVLRPAGTLWVECGDSYGTGVMSNARPAKDGDYPNAWSGSKTDSPKHPTKPKDLLGQPWLLAFALRQDGWYLRQTIIWHKPNAMPESVRDRCTTAHSYVFLFSKQPRYWFDADAIAEPAEWARWGDQTVPKYEGTETASGWMQPKTKAELCTNVARGNSTGRQTNGVGKAFDVRADRADGMKNARSVWTIPTEGYPEAHFATWPQALVERILRAGCPEWVCGTCGQARERLTESKSLKAPWSERKAAGATSGSLENGHSASHGAGVSHDLSVSRRTVGWTDCGHNNYHPGTALDPFMGSGTTALVARRLGRKAISVELNESYCGMAARRLQQLSLLA